MGTSLCEVCLKEQDMRAEQQGSGWSRWTLVAAAATSLVVTSTAWAGPRVGSTIGAPSTASTTVNARVISSTPVVAQVATPRQACYDEVQVTQAQPSGAGAILGAIAGAAVGNAIGRGSGRALATGVGLMGGAVLGNHIETDGKPGGQRTVRRCENQTAYENQVVAYSVVYELNGQQYSTQLPQEPGATIPVQITVSPAVTYQNAPVYQQQAAPLVQYQYQDVQPGVVTIYEDRPYRPHRRHHWD
jgi:uncharacterized protein YcfJ